ncbi:hypothetical protein ABPG72_003610 [Tetrahymena utriculariae]
MRKIPCLILIILLSISKSNQIKEIPHHLDNKEKSKNTTISLDERYFQNRQLGEKCNPKMLVPQSEKIGQGFNILTLEPYPSVFEHHCFQNQTNLDEQWQIPDFVNVIQLKQIEFEQSGYVATNIEEYTSSHTFKFSISTEDEQTRDSIKNIVGVWSIGKNQQYQRIKFNQYVYDYTQLSINMFQAYLSSNWPKLNSQLLKDLENLPKHYDYEAYKKIVDKYGTHFAYQIIIGAKISQEAETLKSYYKKYNETEIKMNFKFFFEANILNKKIQIPGINLGYSKGTSSINQFSAQTNFQKIVIDGIFEYNDFSMSAFKIDPAATYFYYYNISSLMIDSYIKYAADKQKNMNQFLQNYLINSKGCTDHEAINYLKKATIDDNSCIYRTYGGFIQLVDKNCEYQTNIVNQFTKKTECEKGYRKVLISKSIAEDYNQETLCQVYHYLCIIDDNIQNIQIDNLDLLYVQQTCQNSEQNNFFYSILPQKYYYCPQNFVEISFFHLQDPLQIDQNSFYINNCSFKMCVQKNNKNFFSGGYAEISKSCKVSSQIVQQNFHSFINPITSQSSCLEKYYKYPIHSIQISENCSVIKNICSAEEIVSKINNVTFEIIPMFSDQEGNKINEYLFYLTVILPFFTPFILCCVFSVSSSSSKRETAIIILILYYVAMYFLKAFLIDYNNKWAIWKWYPFIQLGQIISFVACLGVSDKNC